MDDPQDIRQGDAAVQVPVCRENPSLSGAPNLGERYQDALLLWLRWNNAYERVTATLYDARHDPRKQEQLLDEMDQLRQQAVDFSRELLDS
ncbi:MAG: hypothetical protein IID44_22065 [Planctomycetes bacterium]|nr:hypothetical protein [Planctomycetota bacterium]